MGGGHVTDAARAVPDLVRRVVNIDGFGPPPFTPDEDARLLDRCAEEGDEAHPSAVIALHDDGLVPPERSVPLCACLERMARRCHAKFISEDDFESELSPERLARYMQATLSIAT